jgi:hypothetical protein
LVAEAPHCRRLSQHSEGVGFAEQTPRVFWEVTSRRELPRADRTIEHQLASQPEHVSRCDRRSIDGGAVHEEGTATDTLDLEASGEASHDELLPRQGFPFERRPLFEFLRPLAVEPQAVRRAVVPSP